MTETPSTTENVPAEVNAEEASPPAPVLSEQQQMLFDMMVAELTRNVEAHNELIVQLMGLSTDPVLVAQNIWENDTSDPTLNDIRTKLGKLEAALETITENRDALLAEKATAKIAESNDADKYKELDAKRAELAQYAKAGKSMLEVQSEAHAAKLPELLNIKGKKASDATGRGAGVPRYRNLTVFWRPLTASGSEQWVRANKKTPKGEIVSTFGEAAKAIGAETIHIVEAYHKSTGQTERKNFPKDHAYSYTHGDKAWEIRVIESAD